MYPTYENTKPLYQRLNRKPGYGSFTHTEEFVCPITIHRLADSGICGKFKEPINSLLMSFAWGFDGRTISDIEQTKDTTNPFNQEFYDAGQALRAAFEQEAPCPKLYRSYIDPITIN